MNAPMLRLPAPAKLNLFLHITGQRPDGYHNLQTLFQFLDLADELSFTPLPSDSIELQHSLKDVPAEQNLIVRAARALQKATGYRAGARITLDKRLPMGGGIGGGSSDAATTLVGLNHLWGTGLTLCQLASIGLSLGADVPVFVHGQAALAEGVGEILIPAQPAESWYLVLRPDCHIATPAVFTDAALKRDTPVSSAAELLSQPPAQWRNDCESVVFNQYPQVEKAFAWLVNFAPARLTGTGSCLFAPFDTEDQARQVLEQSPSELSGFVAKGCNLSPLHRAMATCSASDSQA